MDSQEIRRKTRIGRFWIIALPFATGAAFKFLPLWVSIPAGFVMLLYFFAILVNLAELNKKQ